MLIISLYERLCLPNVNTPMTLRYFIFTTIGETMIALYIFFGCRNDATIKTFNDPPTVDITSHQTEDG